MCKADFPVCHGIGFEETRRITVLKSSFIHFLALRVLAEPSWDLFSQSSCSDGQPPLDPSFSSVSVVTHRASRKALFPELVSRVRCVTTEGNSVIRENCSHCGLSFSHSPKCSFYVGGVLLLPPPLPSLSPLLPSFPFSPLFLLPSPIPSLSLLLENQPLKTLCMQGTHCHRAATPARTLSLEVWKKIQTFCSPHSSSCGSCRCSKADHSEIREDRIGW